MAHSVVEFEATKRKQFRLEEFYKQFKTCLPKMVMVSQGVRGTRSEDTFELGEVIVIIGKAQDVFRTEHKAIKECIEGRYIIEGDISDNSVYLPLDEPDLLVAEVTGIKGQNKTQWVSFQKFVQKRITEIYGDTEQLSEDDEYETCINAVRETEKPMWHLKFISKTIGRIKKSRRGESVTNLKARLSETLHTPLPVKSKQSHNFRTRLSKSPTLNAPKKNEEPKKTQTTETDKLPLGQRRLNKEKFLHESIFNTASGHKTTSTDGNVCSELDHRNENVMAHKHEYENDEFHLKMTNMSTEEEGSDPDYETYSENSCSCSPENTRKTLSTDIQKDSEESACLKLSAGQVSSTLASKIETTPISRMTSLSKTKKTPVIAPKPTVKRINLSLPIVEVKNLSMEDVGKYLKLLNLETYVDIFRENLIDGSLLFSLDEELLTTDLKMNDEEAKKLFQFVKTGDMPLS